MGDEDDISLGEQIIGTFNNEGRDDVAEIKKQSSFLINLIGAYGNDPRRNAIAITHVEQAAMMAVKSIFSEAP